MTILSLRRRLPGRNERRGLGSIAIDRSSQPLAGAYDAFISYHHGRDGVISASLQTAVQKLGKAWYRRRALRVFRDDTSLAASSHLWLSIEQALNQSRFLILLASPESAASIWVDKELSHWLERNSTDTVLVALTAGDLSWNPAANNFCSPDTVPLPPALKRGLTNEPRWIDLRPYRETPRDTRFHELAADFAAAIQGVPKEDLLSQELRQQRRALTLAWSAVGALVLLLVMAGWQWRVAISQEREARTQRNNLIAELGAVELSRGDKDGAIRIAAHAAQLQSSRSGEVAPIRTPSWPRSSANRIGASCSADMKRLFARWRSARTESGSSPVRKTKWREFGMSAAASSSVC